MMVMDRLSKGFGSRPVLDDVSMALEDGLVTVLTGPSGSGKTTLLRILAGLERPDSGTVTIDGAIASSRQECVPPNRRSAGIVFQSPTLWPHMTLLDNVAFAVPGASRRTRRETAAALLETVGIGDLAARHPSQVSHGQAHRAALARSLAPAPRHLLLDEPLANLDPGTREAMLELIVRYAAADGAAILYITHDPEDASRLGGAHYHLKEGQLCAVPPN